MIVVLDNYDSFTFNLVQYMQMAGEDVRVFRNNEISANAIIEMAPKGIVLSPGPCTPNDAGISLELVRTAFRHIPMLGVCLGHQTIGQAFGATIVRASKVMHGKVSEVFQVQDSALFVGIPKVFVATRYHSLVIDSMTMPSVLRSTATTNDGVIMAIEHSEYPIYGVQFHPESILSQYGHDIIVNFLKICKTRENRLDNISISDSMEVFNG